jgi:uncharacterized membrane protein YkoI
MLLGLLVAAPAVIAQSLPPLAGSAAGSPQDEARDAVQRFGVKTFSEIMAIARTRVIGDFVKIELKRKKERWELKIDAVSGDILEVE